MANYQAARALMGKGRNAGEGAAGLSKSSAKKGARKSAVKKGETKEMTLATAGFVSQDMLTDPFFLSALSYRLNLFSNQVRLLKSTPDAPALRIS